MLLLAHGLWKPVQAAPVPQADRSEARAAASHTLFPLSVKEPSSTPLQRQDLQEALESESSEDDFAALQALETPSSHLLPPTAPRAAFHPPIRIVTVSNRPLRC